MSNYTFDQVYLAIKMSADSRINDTNPAKGKLVDLTTMMAELSYLYQQLAVNNQMLDIKLSHICLALLHVDGISDLPPEVISQHFGKEIANAITALVMAPANMADVPYEFAQMRPEITHVLVTSFVQLLQNDQDEVSYQGLNNMELIVKALIHTPTLLLERTLTLIDIHRRTKRSAEQFKNQKTSC